MSNFVYDRLEYVGRSKYITVDICPLRNQVQVSAENPYIFKDGDVQDKYAIDYYKSLRPLGIRLHKSNSNPTIDIKSTTLDNKSVDDKEVSESTTEATNPVIEAEVTVTAEDKHEVIDEEVAESPVIESTTEVVDHITPVSQLATNEEMIEFLDLNYDDEVIRSVAKDAGVKRIQGTWSKMTIINKIIEVNTDYVINLMKNS